MIAVSSPEYSFITLSETEPLPDTYYEGEVCLPVLNLTEIVFQIKVTTDTPALLDTITVSVNIEGPDPTIGGFTWYNVGENLYIGVIDWTVDDPDQFKEARGADCWTIDLFYQDEDDNPFTVPFQNCFQFIDDVKYTALVQYYNDCPEFDFHYSDAGIFYNQLRLNMFMAFPEVSSKRKIYRKSDGTFKRLSTINDKRWAMQTDYITERQFMCLVQATEHNFFQVQDERQQWHRLFMPEGETIKPDWQKQIGLNFRVTQCSWSMMEDFNSSISVLCGNCDDTSYAYYMDEPIGGEL